MKNQIARIQSFAEHATPFIYRNSFDTKGPLNPPSNHNSYIHVKFDAFSHFIVCVPIKSNKSPQISQNRSQNSFTPLDYQIWSTYLPCY